MNDQPSDDVGALSCGDCSQRLQPYLDGDLTRAEALRVFLHVRDCSACERELQSWQTLFHALGGLPDHQPPADFDARVLASVPVAAYGEMASLRRERVPVYLEADFLPSPVRSVWTRTVGVAVAATAVAGVGWLQWPDAVLLLAAAGLAPEILVRLQGLGRRLAIGVERPEGGA